MGWVFRSRHETLGWHAVKVVRRGIPNSHTALARFEQEATILNREIHSNIPRVYDHVVVADSDSPVLSFLIMDFIDGLTLDQWATLSVRTNGEKMNVASQVTEALRAVHERGILHRDVKGGNVLVEESGRAWLCDFGVALDLEASSRVTQAGGFVGTEHYSAPELLENQAPPSEASDLYSLGVVLWELFNECPYIPNIAGREDLVVSEATTVPLPIEAVLRRMLATDIRQRPTLDDVSAVLRSQSGSETLRGISKPGTSEPGMTSVQGRRWSRAAALVAVGIFVAAVLVSAVLRGQGDAELDPAQQTQLEDSVAVSKDDSGRENTPKSTGGPDISATEPQEATDSKPRAKERDTELSDVAAKETRTSPGEVAPHVFRVLFLDPSDPRNSPDPNIRILVDGQKVWSGPWEPTIEISGSLLGDYQLIPNDPFWRFTPGDCTGTLDSQSQRNECEFEVSRL